MSKPDPLKLLAAAAGACSSYREIAALSRRFDCEIAALLLKRRHTLGLSQHQYANRTGGKRDHVVGVEIHRVRPRIADLYAGATILNPATEEGAWQMAAEMQREAAWRVLETETAQLTAAA